MKNAANFDLDDLEKLAERIWSLSLSLRGIMKKQRRRKKKRKRDDDDEEKKKKEERKKK